jgi:hypothetical protein
MNFTTELRKAKKGGDLTISDLARWFDRPRATVHTWLAGRTPTGPAAVVARSDLLRLQWAIEEDHGFPVPPRLVHRHRVKYITDVRNAITKLYRIPRAYPPD